MEYRQIEAFKEIVKMGSMTKAAEAMHITQSTISYRIKSLEEELGVTLIHRHKGSNQVSLTHVGEQFVSLADQWMEIYEKIKDLCDAGEPQVLRIAAPGSLNFFFNRVYKKIREEYPNVKIYIETAYSGEITELVAQGKADLGVTYLPKDLRGTEGVHLGDTSFAIIEKGTKRDTYPYVHLSSLDLNRAALVKGMDMDNPAVKALLEEVFGDVKGLMPRVDGGDLLYDNLEDGEWSLITEAGGERFREEEGLYKYRIERMENISISLSYYLIHPAARNEILVQIIEEFKKYCM